MIEGAVVLKQRRPQLRRVTLPPTACHRSIFDLSRHLSSSGASYSFMVCSHGVLPACRSFRSRPFFSPEDGVARGLLFDLCSLKSLGTLVRKYISNFRGIACWLPGELPFFFPFLPRTGPHAPPFPAWPAPYFSGTLFFYNFNLAFESF